MRLGELRDEARMLRNGLVEDCFGMSLGYKY
jgi:hypothetical protein